MAGVKIVVRQITSNAGAGDGLIGSPGEFKSCWGPLPAQPPQVTTDAEGRFRLTGLGRDRRVELALEGPTIPHQDYTAATRHSAVAPAGLPFEIVAIVPRAIRGVVRDKATGQPLAGVKMSLAPADAHAFTDKEGRYELLINPTARLFSVSAKPQSGQPYFASVASPKKTPGLAPLTADFELVRGLTLRGTSPIGPRASRRRGPRSSIIPFSLIRTARRWRCWSLSCRYLLPRSRPTVRIVCRFCPDLGLYWWQPPRAIPTPSPCSTTGS